MSGSALAGMVPIGWPSGPTTTTTSSPWASSCLGLLLLGHATNPSSAAHERSLRGQRVSTIFPECDAVLHQLVRAARRPRGASSSRRSAGSRRRRRAARRSRRHRSRWPPSPTTGRARSEVAVTDARLRSRALMSSSPLAPPCMPMITSRPSVARAATLRPRYFAPMLSRMTSAPPASVEHARRSPRRGSRSRGSAPSERHSSSFSGDPAVVNTSRAARGGELDRHRADPAGAAVDEEALALLQVRDHEHVGPHGRRDLGQAGRLDEGDAARHRHDLADRHHHACGVPATGEQRAHLVADRPARRRPRRARRSGRCTRGRCVSEAPGGGG